VAVTLPKYHTAHETVDVEGELLDIRVITRAEQARFQKMVEAETPKDELESALLAVATDTPIDEVRAWYATTPGYVVEEIMGHISRISRLGEGAQKSSGTGDSPGRG
jgi:hypothetical protein